MAQRRSTAVLVLLTVLAAVGLGLGSRLLASRGVFGAVGPGDSFKPWLIALGGPWLAVSWLLGRVAGATRWGAVSGALALTGGTAVWYALTIHRRGAAVHDRVVLVATAWAAAGLAAGAAFGALGSLARSERGDAVRAVGVAFLAGGLVGEALLLITQWSARPARIVLGGELLIGLALPVALLARRPHALLLCLGFSAVTTVLAAGSEDVVRDAIRGAGWGGR
jgi:hypothetical protein